MEIQEPADDGERKRGRRGPVVILLVAAGVALAISAALILGGGSGTQRRSDLGSAPERGPTLYTPISGTADPAPIGTFPNRAEDGGPLHRDAEVVWLGSGGGGDSDDGVTLPPLPAEGGESPTLSPGVLLPCSKSPLVVVVSTKSPSDTRRNGNAYLNVFADWNRDGRFSGGDGCAEEWAVRNHEIPLSSLDDEHTIVGVSVPSGEQTAEFWMRATVTLDEPVTGPHPKRSFEAGETEDVLVSRFPAEHGAPVSRAGCLGYLPPAIPGGESAALEPRPSGYETGGGIGPAPDISAGFDGSTGPAVPALLDPSSRMATVAPPQVPAPRYGYVDIGGDRCRFVALPAGSDDSARLRANLNSESVSLGVGTSRREALPLVPYCAGAKVFSGGTAIIPIHRFPPAGGATPAGDSITASLTIRDPEIPLSPTAEATPTRQPGPSPRLAVLSDRSGSIMGVSIHAPPDLQDRRYVIEIRSSQGKSVGISCSVEIAGPEPRPAEGGRAEAAPAVGLPGIGGDYDVTFSKKSDSCGIFELRSEERLRIRQYGERIEVQRQAGNLSSGQITSPGSFRATGSGQAKDGTPYIESYSVRIFPDGFAGSYDLQRDGCRVSFGIEADRR